MNNIIIQTKTEMFNTDCFYYNNEKHYLNYHVPYSDDGGEWATISNVDCEIGNMNCNILLILTERKEQKNV